MTAAPCESQVMTVDIEASEDEMDVNVMDVSVPSAPSHVGSDLAAAGSEVGALMLPQIESECQMDIPNFNEEVADCIQTGGFDVGFVDEEPRTQPQQSGTKRLLQNPFSRGQALSADARCTSCAWLGTKYMHVVVG